MSAKKHDWVPRNTDLLSHDGITVSSRASTLHLSGEDIEWFLHAPPDRESDGEHGLKPKKGVWFVTAKFVEAR